MDLDHGSVAARVRDKTQADPASPEMRSHLLELFRQETQRQPVASAVPCATTGQAGDERLAHVVSQIGSPPILVGSALVMMASTVSSPSAWRWAGAYALLAILLPMLHLVWLVRRGHVTGLDVPLRGERTRPFIFAAACAMAGWLSLWGGAAPLPMIVLARTLSLQALMVLGITLRWKISLHCTTAAGMAMLAWSLIGTRLPLLIGVPLIAWSRVRLGRHTWAQAIAGALLGFTLFLATPSLMRGV